MPCFIIADRPGRKADQVELEEVPRPKLPTDHLHLEPPERLPLIDWTALRRMVTRVFSWRPKMTEDVCQLRQDPRGGLRVWTGVKGHSSYTLREVGPDGQGSMGIPPDVFALYEDGRHIASLRERRGGWGKVNYLVGLGSDRNIYSVEVRDRGEVHLAVEHHEPGEAGSIRAQEADAVERDPATDWIIVPGGTRF
jgi:hypothetical protein